MLLHWAKELGCNFVRLTHYPHNEYIVRLAEKMGHHPDIYLAWGKVRLSLWTHTTNGLTQRDFALAAKIDKIY